MIPYPSIDPVAIHIGSFGIRWYSLAYIAGIVLGWWVFAREHARKPISNLSPKALDDTVVWVTLGIILGGRLGYVLLYKPAFYLTHPLQILYVWEGGMSFHGGLVGVIVAFFMFCRKYKIALLEFTDVAACVVPIGLFFGRIANFINGELYGRASDVTWAMIFPHGGEAARHPSQLYEAALEGIALFALLMLLLKYTRARSYPGLLSGIFLMGYSAARIFVECFREPDEFLGFLYGGATMGQLLSVPMLLLGMYLVFRSGNAHQKPH